MEKLRFFFYVATRVIINFVRCVIPSQFCGIKCNVSIARLSAQRSREGKEKKNDKISFSSSLHPGSIQPVGADYHSGFVILVPVFQTWGVEGLNREKKNNNFARTQRSLPNARSPAICCVHLHTCINKISSCG